MSIIKIKTWPVISIIGAIISLSSVLFYINEIFGMGMKMIAVLAGATLAFLLGTFAQHVGALIRRLPHRRRVFVSYSMRDSADVAQYIESLKGSVAKLWVSNEQLPSGVPVKESIEQAVNDADCFVGFLTGHVSRYMMFELERAVERGIRVVMVLLADTRLPIDISGLHVIDMRKDRERGLKELHKLVS